jgi:hypothetical protein
VETLSRDRGFQRKPASPGFWFHVTRATSVRSAAVRSCPESGRLAVASASGGQKPPRISTKQAHISSQYSELWKFLLETFRWIEEWSDKIIVVLLYCRSLIILRHLTMLQVSEFLTCVLYDGCSLYMYECDLYVA